MVDILCNLGYGRYPLVMVQVMTKLDFSLLMLVILRRTWNSYQILVKRLSCNLCLIMQTGIVEMTQGRIRGMSWVETSSRR